MTVSSDNQCSKARIKSFFQGELSRAELELFETHLAECEACRLSLVSTTADREFYEKAKLYLHDDEGEVLPFLSSTCGDHADAVDSLSGSRVLELLAPTDDPNMLGRLGEYEISGVVGCGGMGAVLKGFDRPLNRVVAIKVMAPHLASSASARKRFAREAQAAAAVTHDNVIDIYGVAEANGLPYLVMPYARGPSLRQRIDREGVLSVIEVLRIGQQVAAGLAAAHQQGLVHRDIKPANIILQSEGIERLVIPDFGLARAVDDASVTRTGVIAGTPQYMSPEQARGDAVDHRSDLFSLGSVLYTACTGRLPFHAESTFGILRRITDCEPRSIREVNPTVPDWLSRVISKLHAKSPDERYQSAEEISELLLQCIAHVQMATVGLPAELDSHSKYGGKVQAAMAFAACCAVVGLVCFGPDPISRVALPSANPTQQSRSGHSTDSSPAIDPVSDKTAWDAGVLSHTHRIQAEAKSLLSETEQDFAIGVNRNSVVQEKSQP